MKRTVDSLTDLAGKTVLCRVDFNVPLDGTTVTDDTRIVAALPTIQHLIDAGAKTVLCSHLGRPKQDAREKWPSLSLRPAAVRLAELLDQPVAFADDCLGEPAETAKAALAPGDVLLLENTRFHRGEEKNDAEVARGLAAGCDLYVNDAFGAAHRAHASTEGVTHHLPAVAGFLMEKEVLYLSALVASPPRPFAAVIGGAKVSTKIAAIEHLLPKLDILVLGGGMANTFLKARGVDVQGSLVEAEQVEVARRVLAEAARRDVEVHLPGDVVAASAFDENAEARTCAVDEVPPGWMILDIGPESVRVFAAALGRARAVLWNGPMGVFEWAPFAGGSAGLARAIAALDATTVVGGGETAAVVAAAGLQAAFTHVSTGGGASLEMLEGRVLPGVAALLDA